MVEPVSERIDGLLQSRIAFDDAKAVDDDNPRIPALD
jgi:hypothetical protein